MGLVEARKEIAGFIADLDDIRSAPERIPEGFTGGPFVAAHADIGTYEMGPAGRTTGLHDLLIEVHVVRRDLPRDYDKIEPLIEAISIMLQTKLTEKKYTELQTFEGISYALEPAEYANTETLALFIRLHGVKIQTNL
jgi:hypothetical protein